MLQWLGISGAKWLALAWEVRKLGGFTSLLYCFGKDTSSCVGKGDGLLLKFVSNPVNEIYILKLYQL